MSKATRQLMTYINDRIKKGHSLHGIEKELIKQGYPKHVAEGIILHVKYRKNTFQLFGLLILAILFVAGISITGSGVIGMATVNYARTYSDTVNIVVENPDTLTWNPSQEGAIVSLLLTGHFRGNGSAMVSLQKEGEELTIIDSYNEFLLKTFEDTRYFELACEETCSLENMGEGPYSLVFDFNGAVVELTTINYDLIVTEDVSVVPEFITIPSQITTEDSTLSFDLSTFFTSSAEVVYNALAEEQFLDVSVEGDIATVNTKRIGKSYVYFIGEIEDRQYISNLVEIDVQEGPVSQRLITGEIKSGTFEVKQTFWEIFLFMLLILFLVIFIPIFIRSVRRRHLPKKHTIKKAVKVVKETVDELKKPMPKKEARSSLLDLFYEQCDKFEEAESRKEKERIYSRLRKIYTTIMKSSLRMKDKKVLYTKLEEYYKDLQ
ncbi:hypothetical protein GOV09_03595 [Candidatus Woesearchaeota archaeon]|nr:hypothetical protein [Candidatus Woesearchaeota archaeon]